MVNQYINEEDSDGTQPSAKFQINNYVQMFQNSKFSENQEQ